MAEYILAIDNGTQSIRAMLVDAQGKIHAIAKQPIEAYTSPQPGWAEQHPDYFWEMLCAACQQLWQNTDIPKSAIAGVTLTTQRATVILLDEHHAPLYPAIVWLDERRSSNLKPLSLHWRLLFQLARADDLVQYLRHEAEANWFSKNQPELWRNMHKFVLLSGYLNYRLTGRLADATGNQVGYIPFNVKTKTWEHPRNWKWQALDLTPDKMPELVPTGDIIGTITADAAEASGIPAGLPVIAAAADKACEVIGSGTNAPHIGAISYGTTATINVLTDKYFESTPFLPPYPAALPDAYNVEIQIYRGYWMVEWFKREFGYEEQRLATERNIPPETLLDELVTAVPPGSEGLILQPYWTPGIRQPGPEARGAIIGFNDRHTRAHIYRAILEGVAYALREGQERLEKRGRLKLTELRVSGGGSQSDAAMQLTADIFNLPVLRPHTYETSGLGAAIIASVGLGIHPDFESAIKNMTRLRDTFQPQSRYASMYEQLYQRVYKRMYKRLQPLYYDLTQAEN